MSLFKVFKGPESDLNKIPVHEGYAYLTNEGHLWVDTTSDIAGRIAVTAYNLVGDDGTTVEVDDILLKSDAYTKTEVDNKVAAATSKAYTATLYASSWVASVDETTYTYSYSNTELTCGSAGTTPPVISCTANVDEYSNITSADATPKSGIVFTASAKPANDIQIVIVDVK